MESNISPLLAALREQDKDGEKEEDRKLFRDKKDIMSLIYKIRSRFQSKSAVNHSYIYKGKVVVTTTFPIID